MFAARTNRRSAGHGAGKARGFYHRDAGSSSHSVTEKPARAAIARRRKYGDPGRPRRSVREWVEWVCIGKTLGYYCYIMLAGFVG
jgi:hypothetical protein